MNQSNSNYTYIDGVKVHYLLAGSGPAVLLVHGLGASVVTWERNIQPLVDAGYQVVAPDLPGHGDSDKPKDISYDPSAGARLLQRLADRLDIKRVSLVGNSAGGLIAGMFALNYTKRVDRLVLVASGGLGREVAWFLRLFSVPGLGEMFYQPQLLSDENFSRRLFYRTPPLIRRVLNEMRRVRGLPGSRHATLQALRSSVNLFGLRPHRYILPGLSRLPVPVLTVWGEEDNVLPVGHALSVRQAMPHSLVHTMPQCGHWPHMEKSEEFNALLTQFLSGEMEQAQK
ncbi:MAG: alpha/beta fold hydrolase [SAR202 cluster bacterium]|nr:alpha/beta fold hydrolase [SAR202 cluster bacterium]